MLSRNCSDRLLFVKQVSALDRIILEWRTNVSVSASRKGYVGNGVVDIMVGEVGVQIVIDALCGGSEVPGCCTTLGKLAERGTITPYSAGPRARTGYEVIGFASTCANDISVRRLDMDLAICGTAEKEQQQCSSWIFSKL